MPELLDHHRAGGYTELGPVHGAGQTGKREGSRAWPGDASVYFSIVPQEQVESLREALAERAQHLDAGERLHAAVMPTDSFF
ncbi:MAG TPA: hypothetical protein VK928_12770 [Longimicrobiales bacterium]|nr:hypothetical protein [Longimicrobiales bacterium]